MEHTCKHCRRSPEETVFNAKNGKFFLHCNECYRKGFAKKSKGACSVLGCPEPLSAKGYCKYHYNRFNRYGDLEDHSRSRGACSVEQCGQIHASHGYCDRHYRRFLKYGDPLGSAPKIPRSTPCKVEGCPRLSKTNGLCGTHAARMERWGDPTIVRRKLKKDYKVVSGVYFMVCRDMVKIGFSSDVRRRRMSAQVNCPFPLEVVAVLPGGLQEEAILHERFKVSHTQGEWFHLSKDIRLFIRHLLVKNPLPNVGELEYTYVFEKRAIKPIKESAVAAE